MLLRCWENSSKDRSNAEILDPCQESVILRRLFWIQSNIYDGAFCENSKRLSC